MHNERIELKIPAEVQQKTEAKKKKRESRMKEMTKSDGFKDFKQTQDTTEGPEESKSLIEESEREQI